jgi:Peptidase family M23
MIWLVAVMLIVCLAVPLGYAWRMARLNEPSKAAWLLAAVEASLFVALVLILGRWDMAGADSWYLVLAIFAAAAIWSLPTHWSRPWRVDSHPVLRRRWTSAGSALLFASALAYVLFSVWALPQPRELAFPLKGGRFMVAQGGGIKLLNYHAQHREQRYAADITALNAAGFRSSGLLPQDLSRYAIYGAEVVSPCTGSIVSLRGDLPDLVPPNADRDNARGNHVIIDCGGLNIVLAHLQQGSINAVPGQKLATGDLIGRVGNSGNTTEPHLHIHAVDPQTQKGQAIAFGGRPPLRNRLYVN